jgi:hypothetical protein
LFGAIRSSIAHRRRVCARLRTRAFCRQLFSACVSGAGGSRNSRSFCSTRSGKQSTASVNEAKCRPEGVWTPKSRCTRVSDGDTVMRHSPGRAMVRLTLRTRFRIATAIFRSDTPSICTSMSITCGSSNSERLWMASTIYQSVWHRGARTVHSSIRLTGITQSEYFALDPSTCPRLHIWNRPLGCGQPVSVHVSAHSGGRPRAVLMLFGNLRDDGFHREQQRRDRRGVLQGRPNDLGGIDDARCTRFS